MSSAITCRVGGLSRSGPGGRGPVGAPDALYELVGSSVTYSDVLELVLSRAIPGRQGERKDVHFDDLRDTGNALAAAKGARPGNGWHE